MSKRDRTIYLAGAIVGALAGAPLAYGLRISPVAAVIAELAAIVVGLIVAFVVNAVSHAFTPSERNERGQITIGDLIGFGLIAGLFVVGVLNLQFIEDFASGVDGMLMLGYSQNATDQYEGFYKQMPCPGTTCNVTVADYKPLVGAGTSAVLPYTPTVWGDTSDITFTDESVAGGASAYELKIGRAYDTRVIGVLAQTGYTGTQTHLALISGQGLTALP